VSVELTDLARPWPGGLEEVPLCPVCGDPRRREELAGARDGAFGTAPGEWRFQRCLGCHTLYLDPRPDRASVHLAYTNYYTHKSTPQSNGVLSRIRKALANGYRNRVFATRRNPSIGLGALVMPLFPARAAHILREDRGLGRATAGDKRVLDVGCGNGDFLSWARELGWSCHGIEIDPVAAAVARAQGVTILGSELGELSEEYTAAFDAITLSHVIEHVHDPVELLRQCRRVLRPGGYLWLETPNSDSLGYEEYKAHWRGLEAPRHLALFTPASLRLSLERTGFERIQVLPPAHVVEPMFVVSAAIRLGRIAERDTTPLPDGVRKQALKAARRARSVLQRHPERSEFVTISAYRP
jgi:2-polyprenyl-3-methyl-5-hydroxy-6-metoxy-1,4-benzoquinol methylase